MSMKVPPIGSFGTFGVQKLKKNSHKDSYFKPNFIEPLKSDIISFGSTAKYIKRYATLPDEIKKILKPKDAVDMFKNMELIAKGVIKKDAIGKGENSKIYENPWLPNYYVLILDKSQENVDTITVYSGEKIGDSIWQDEDNWNIQILQASI